MSDEKTTPLIENEVNHDALKYLFRREVDEKRAFLKDLKDLPEIPSKKTMQFLSSSYAVNQVGWSISIQLQKDLPVGTIPYKTEYETGAGIYTIIRNALLESCKEAERDALQSTDPLTSPEQDWNKKAREALDIAIACGAPERVSMYDEEGVEGWRWLHPDGREWNEVGAWEEIPFLHPLLAEIAENH